MIIIKMMKKRKVNDKTLIPNKKLIYPNWILTTHLLTGTKIKNYQTFEKFNNNMESAYFHCKDRKCKGD